MRLIIKFDDFKILRPDLHAVTNEATVTDSSFNTPKSKEIVVTPRMFTNAALILAVLSPLGCAVSQSDSARQETSSSIASADRAGAKPTTGWMDVTTDNDAPSRCDTTRVNCTLRDLAAKRDWNRSNNALFDHQGAKQFCDNLTHNGLTDWRLPTINELTTAFDHGIFSASTPDYWKAQAAYQSPDAPVYWSSSKTPDNKASVINLQHGNSWTSDRQFTYRVICTRIGGDASAPSAEQAKRKLNHVLSSCAKEEDVARARAEVRCFEEMRPRATAQCRNEGYSRAVINYEDGFSSLMYAKETVWGNPVWACAEHRCWMDFQCSGN